MSMEVSLLANKVQTSYKASDNFNPKLYSELLGNW